MDKNGRRPCDLVMKGGITSGVVYPGAVVELAKTYRFKNIGGTSAGAIAAAVTAAAEYGRQQSGDDDLPGLDRVTDDLAGNGFLLSLFQPAPGARVAFRLLVQARRLGRSPFRAALGGLWVVLRYFPWFVLLALLLWGGLLALAVGELPSPKGTGEVTLAVVAALAVTATLAGAALGSTALVLALGLWRSLEANGWGMCPGVRQSEGADPALTEWLDERIQACALRSPDEAPLTFRDLEGESDEERIRLEMMTTDLSLARPVRLPPEEGAYRFEPDEMRRLFPERIVRHLIDHAGSGPDGKGRFPLPSKELPVLVAVRMSLSFPLLLSAVPLYSQHPRRRELIKNWLSDGGLSSNFPIHFFDSWLPGWPTFGLDLQPFPEEHVEGHVEEVFMPSSPEDEPHPHWTDVKHLKQFIRQVLDVMENWRDTLQSELPGFRDRICQVRLRKTEGRLNLDMDPPTIAALLERGHKAGVEIQTKFNDRHWREHRFARYLTFMQMMEVGLGDVRKTYGDFAPELAAGMEGVDVYRMRHDASWCRGAETATRELLERASAWAPPPAALGFNLGEEPKPTPVMRITSKA